MGKEFDKGALKTSKPPGDIPGNIRIFDFDDRAVLSAHFDKMKIEGLSRFSGKSNAVTK